MKRLFTLLTITCLLWHNHSISQQLSLSFKDAPVLKLIQSIEKQTDYRFVYTKELLDLTHPVTIELVGNKIEVILNACLRNQPLSFSIEEHIIILRRKDEPPESDTSTRLITGKVVSESGVPLSGISIRIKQLNRGVFTNESGDFKIRGPSSGMVLTFSGAERETVEMKVNSSEFLTVSLSQKISQLDETIIKGYYNTSRRLNTGSVTKITGRGISIQPVSNLFQALQGRVPGLFITQTSGIPGSSMKIEVRGRNSISQGSQPLFIIDGIPFAPGNSDINQLPSALTVNDASGFGMSPFFLINPNDIAEVEVLKDAEATAIYGSRGANGVILINTHKPTSGRPTITLDYSTGWSRPARTAKWLNTPDYITIREEAFRNDGLTPTTTPGSTTFAPDLLVWDRHRYTDFQRVFTGKSANRSNTQLSVNGGSEQFRFLLSATHLRESTVFPDSDPINRSSFNFHIQYVPAGSALNLSFFATYGIANSKLPSIDPTHFISLPPNFPSFYDPFGRLKWEDGGISFNSIGIENPMAQLLRENRNRSENLLSSLQVSYTLLPKLDVGVNLGLNNLYVDESLTTPNRSLDPQSGLLGYASFGNSSRRSWNIEPQVDYEKDIGKGKLNMLLGMTFLGNDRRSTLLTGTGYTNDALIHSIEGAGEITGRQTAGKYRYASLFTRINFTLRNRYIINASIRRDASSRFGPEQRMANFLATSAGWIFTNEEWMKPLISVLSFGKIRASYGNTGNDQIGDYRYLDQWSPSTVPYVGSPGLSPTGLFNARYAWEITRKMDIGLELGFLQDRFLLSIDYYRNRSDNQLLNIRIPRQTGFAEVLQNVDALIENRGWEFMLETRNIHSKEFSWHSSLQLSMPRNRLLHFPFIAGLDESAFGYRYSIGESLNSIRGYRLIGVDPNSGLSQFDDINKDGQLTPNEDFVGMGSRDPKIIGGFQNTLRWGNWEMDLLVEFRKQRGYIDRASLADDFPYSVPAVGFYNFPQTILRRWQRPGDQSSVQMLTASGSSPAFATMEYFNQSSGIYGDASFIRLNNLSIAFSIPAKSLRKIKLKEASIYLRGQNLLMISGYRGANPENQDLFVLAPLRNISAGIKMRL